MATFCDNDIVKELLESEYFVHLHEMQGYRV